MVFYFGVFWRILAYLDECFYFGVGDGGFLVYERADEPVLPIVPSYLVRVDLHPSLCFGSIWMIL